jgi:hypothetical protein
MYQYLSVWILGMSKLAAHVPDERNFVVLPLLSEGEVVVVVVLVVVEEGVGFGVLVLVRGLLDLLNRRR